MAGKLFAPPPAKAAPGKRPKLKHVRVPSKDRAYFTSNLALLLKAGVTVGEAFTSLRETTHSAALRHVLDQMNTDIEEGMPLWKAMERSRVVSSQTLALVRLGEESGKLVDNLHVASRQEEKQRIFRSKVRTALLYPTFVLGVTGIVGLGVAWFLLPRLAQTFKQLNAHVPLISRVLISFGIFLKHDGFWAVPAGLAVLFLLGYVLFGAPKTKGIGQRILYHIPGVSKLMYEVEIARFGYLLGTLLQAGLSVTQALRLLCDATSSIRYKKLYTYLIEAFEEGYSFRTSLPRYKAGRTLLPAAVQQMVIAGERSGALPETLLSIGGIYEEKSDDSTQNLEVILEPILLVFVAGGVLAVAVAVILPIYSLVGNLRQ